MSCLYLTFALFFTPCSSQQGRAAAVFPISTSVCSISVSLELIMCMQMSTAARDSTQELCRHHNKVCTESWLWKKNLLLHPGIKPASVWCLAFWPDAVPLSCPAPLLYWMRKWWGWKGCTWHRHIQVKQRVFLCWERSIKQFCFWVFVYFIHHSHHVHMCVIYTFTLSHHFQEHLDVFLSRLVASNSWHFYF